jgi:hypothetical protein
MGHDLPLSHACRQCGATMEVGYVLGQNPGAGGGQATIAWLSGDFDPKGLGIIDSMAADPLFEVGMTPISRIPRFRAFRCRECSVVEFTYANPIL